jgi:redox-sensitive bicupin YhaK (pirin superfamily)
MVPERQIEFVIDSKAKDLGDFLVRRALPSVKKRMVGPFIFMDHMGPVELEIGHGMDVRPHPHIGLSTLTYLYEGSAFHRDTLGAEQEITPGAVNWMTAGRGIAHSERSTPESRKQRQRLHGIQTWIALPTESEEVAPAFNHYSANSIPEISEQGSICRVIAGLQAGVKSPVSVYSELTYLDLQIPMNQRFIVDQPTHELAVYVAIGSVLIGDHPLGVGQLAVLTSGTSLMIQAQQDARVLVMGGLPFPETRHIWWNFVSSSKERIEKAKQDWREQAFGTIKGETEFIPLPEV